MTRFNEKFGIKPKNMSAEQKTFVEECEKGFYEFKPDRSFNERCEIVRRTMITTDMTYEERMAMLKRRYGL